LQAATHNTAQEVGTEFYISTSLYIVYFHI